MSTVPYSDCYVCPRCQDNTLEATAKQCITGREGIYTHICTRCGYQESKPLRYAPPKR